MFPQSYRSTTLTRKPASWNMNIDEFLFEDHEVKYFKLSKQTSSESEINDIVSLVASAFTDEPMNACRGVSFELMKSFVSTFIHGCIASEASVYATMGGKLVGAFICRDFKASTPEELNFVVDPLLEPIGAILQNVDEKYENYRHKMGLPPLKLGDAIDFWMVGVCSSARHRNVATNLLKSAIMLAKRLGFKYGVMECSSAFTQAMAKKEGFTERAAIPYASFQFNDLNIFSSVPHPHIELKLFELDIGRN